jgi:TRAP-type transport system periplasmic protein
MKRVFLFSVLIVLSLVLALGGCASSAPAPTSTSNPPAPASSSAKPAPPPATPTSTALPATSAVPATTQASAGSPTNWKIVSFLPRAMFAVRNVTKMVDRVGQRSNGRLTIQFLGGPEVMPPPALVDGVRNNVIQMAFLPIDLYEAQVGLGNMMVLSELSPEEERASRAYDFVNAAHNKIGIFYLERGSYSSSSIQFNIITNKLVDKPQLLASQIIGANTPIIVPFMKKIGGAPNIIPQSDYYTSLERGVVNGICDPLQNEMTLQLYEVCKYVVDPPFYRSAVVFIVNLNSWNALPKDLQTMITSTSGEIIKEYMVDFDQETAKARQTATDKGMKFTKFSDADQQWFLKNLYDAAWDDNARRYPDNVAKLRPMVTKK